jgi:hypothetical protein
LNGAGVSSSVTAPWWRSSVLRPASAARPASQKISPPSAPPSISDDIGVAPAATRAALMVDGQVPYSAMVDASDVMAAPGAWVGLKGGVLG